MNIIFGHIGSDAGWWYVGADGKVHHVGGWNPEALAEVSRAVSVLGEAVQLKTPGLADGIVKSLTDHVQKEFRSHLKDGGVLVLTRG